MEDMTPVDDVVDPEPHMTFISVPNDFSLIDEAMDYAKSGDTVVVEPGTYNEHIDFRGKSVLLTSRFYETGDVSFIKSTIIKGSSSSVVIFMNNEKKDAVIQGFTITGGTGIIYTRPNLNVTLGGGGIMAFRSSPTIRFNIIQDNEATNTSGANSFAGGGGIRAELGSPIIQNNIIQSNKGGFGGGIFLDATAATVTNNVITGNRATKSDFGGGGGLYLDFVLPSSAGNKIINNTITNNFSAGTGGGVTVAGETVFDKLIFTNNIIHGNQQNEIFARFGANEIDFEPTYCLIEGGFSSGIEILNADPMLVSGILSLEEGSPCIDSGDPSAAYNDVSEGGNAVLPSLGTSRNDMGAFGGPGAFSIME